MKWNDDEKKGGGCEPAALQPKGNPSPSCVSAPESSTGVKGAPPRIAVRHMGAAMRMTGKEIVCQGCGRVLESKPDLGSLLALFFYELDGGLTQKVPRVPFIVPCVGFGTS